MAHQQPLRQNITCGTRGTKGHATFTWSKNERINAIKGSPLKNTVVLYAGLKCHTPTNTIQRQEFLRCLDLDNADGNVG